MSRLIVMLLPVVPAMMMGYSDFKERRVSVLSIALFAACCLCSSVLSLGWKGMALRFAENLALLILFCLALKLYFRCRGQKDSRIIDRMFGLGDALFLVCTGMLMDIATLCLFISASCIAGLLWGMISKNREIPFIGMASPVLLLFLLADNLF